MTDELKPCPFCGGAPKLREWDWPDLSYLVCCSLCGANVGSQLSTKEEAVAAWNRRPTPAEQGDGDVEALAARLREGLRGVTPGPWCIYDGCSWRRIGTVPAVGRDYDDCAVLYPYAARDGHPDLGSGRGQDTYANLRHIARCDPQTITAILDEMEQRNAQLATANARIAELEGALDGLLSCPAIADEDYSDPEWGDGPTASAIERARRASTATEG